jgi:hypothetical protein
VQAQPMKFACPSVVLREGETNSGATEIFHPWAAAVAQAQLEHGAQVGWGTSESKTAMKGPPG